MASKKETAAYLLGVNAVAGVEYCKRNDLDSVEIIPFEYSTPEEVGAGLQALSDGGISLAYIFSCPEVWSIYLKSLAEERYHTAIELVLFHGAPSDLLLYLRACYRFGYPAISDLDFDSIERLYYAFFPNTQFLQEKTADDDEYTTIVQDALKMSGSKSVGKKAVASIQTFVEKNPEFADLNAEKSTSIKPVVTVDEAFAFWCNTQDCPTHFSLKVDGINTKALFDENGLSLALSRGRSADSLDYTEAVRSSLNINKVDVSKIRGKVTAESFVPPKDLEYIAAKYSGKDYKTPKSTAMAMLRAPHQFDPEDLKYLKMLAFDYSGQPVDKAFEELQAAGMSVPPYLKFPAGVIPRDSLQNFEEWMNNNVIEPMWQSGIEQGIGSDGVVMQLLTSVYTDRKDVYSDRNIALKYGPWRAASYVSRVREIVFEQRRVEASIVLIIDPVVTRDLNTATRVGVGSPDILIQDGVKVGDLIEFERKSEAYNVYLAKREG